jgi:hypothetical protein
VWQDSVSAIKENAKPYEFNLYQNFPNPFNPKTVIRYQLTATEHVTLIVYNLPGDEIEKLVDEDQHAGMHSVVFPRSNGQLASGMYFYRLLAGGKSLTKKMILMK